MEFVFDESRQDMQRFILSFQSVEGSVNLSVMEQAAEDRVLIAVNWKSQIRFERMTVKRNICLL